MRIKGFSLLLLGFLVIWTGHNTSAADLRGRFALSAKGGLSFATGRGFSYEDQVKEAYGFGLGLEYFFVAFTTLSLVALGRNASATPAAIAIAVSFPSFH